MYNNAMQSKYKHFTDGGRYVSKEERMPKILNLQEATKR